MWLKLRYMVCEKRPAACSRTHASKLARDNGEPMGVLSTMSPQARNRGSRANACAPAMTAMSKGNSWLIRLNSRKIGTFGSNAYSSLSLLKVFRRLAEDAL